MEQISLKNIIQIIEAFAPTQLQESYDNAGLICGSADMLINGAICSLDCTEAIVDEAIAKNCNLIIAHHPIIFSGLKKINGKNYVERTIIKAIKNDIAIYAAHTNLDNVLNGVNHKIAEKLGLTNLQVLAPKTNQLKKIITYCPISHAEIVRQAIFEAGAGEIGKYDCCSFNISGTGTFRANAGAQPFSGEIGKLKEEQEMRIETVLPFYLQNKVVAALKSAHPYEEVAYDIFPMDNYFGGIGSGLTGELPEALEEKVFFNHIKQHLNIEMIRHTPFLNKKIKKVAICGGAGSFLLKNAINSKSDVYISGDFKYHEFFDAEGKILIADVGHAESEQFTPEIFYDLIRKNFATFAIHLSNIRTNPVHYFY
jgi:dinuclear metal center YbgI/SA1388 family protein